MPASASKSPSKAKRAKLSDDESTPTGKKRPSTMVIDDSDSDVGPSSKPPPRKKPATGPSSAGKKRKAETSDEEDVKPQRSSSKKGKGKAEPLDDSVVADDDEEEDVKPKRPVAKPKAKAAKKEEAEDDEDMKEDVKPAKPKWDPGKQVGVPSAPGSKEIPQGKPNCLAGLTFVFTGELESLGREEAQELAKRYGGRVTGAPSGATSYVIIGANAGESKLKVIAKKGIATLDEDGYLNLIATRKGGQLDEKAKKKIKEEEAKVVAVAKSMGPPKGTQDDKTHLWTVKYAPTALKDICGNKGVVEKMQSWLHDFEKSRHANFKKGGKDGLGLHRCLLISGAPGIGKTTAAHLVAKLEDYSVLELNASDTRGKKLLDAVLRSTIDNRPIDSFFGMSSVVGSSKKVDLANRPQRMVLIMDEVDGMSAGDRGGVGALNALIKKSKVPIIAICNDAKSPKMKPLIATTLHLPFRKPEANAIKSRMMSLCFKEGIKVEGNAIAQLIEGANSDIRQVINLLATWKLSQNTMSFDEGKKLVASQVKNTIQTPFTLINSLFSPYAFKSTAPGALNAKLDLYFADYSAVPLFVQENYLKHKFSNANNLQGRDLELKRIQLVSRAAGAISDGDLVDRLIHSSEQQWSLLPVHGMFSTIRPSYWCHGAGGWGKDAMSNTNAFPAWFGKNSTQGKLQRLLGEIQIRMRTRVSGDRREIRQSYLPTLFPKLVGPLVNEGAEGIESTIAVMDYYYLSKDEFDAVMELGMGELNGEEAMKGVPTAVKSAFTRTYNKGDHPQIFHKGTDIKFAKKLGKGAAPDLEDVAEASDSGDDEAEEDAGDDDDDQTKLGKDKLIKVKKAGAKGKAKAPAKPKAKT